MKKNEIFKTGMCFGTFDKFHLGHQSYISQAKKLFVYLIVVVARDKNVLALKGKLPFENEKQRLNKIKKLSEVDKAVLGKIRDKYGWLKKINPDIIFLGYDQEVDIKELKKVFKGRIIRLKSFRPDIYKSSKIK